MHGQTYSLSAAAHILVSNHIKEIAMFTVLFAIVASCVASFALAYMMTRDDTDAA